MPPTSRCPACGAPGARLETPDRHRYSHCGLHNVHLQGAGVVIIDCPSCRTRTTTIHQEAQLLQVLGLAIVLSGPGLTGEELRFLRKLCEMTQDEFARAVGKSRRETIAEWEALETARLFKTAGDELGLRAILMSLFGARVLASEYCCLSPRHRALFAQAAGSFIERAPALLAARPRRAPLEIRRTGRGGDWAVAAGVVG